MRCRWVAKLTVAAKYIGNFPEDRMLSLHTRILANEALLARRRSNAADTRAPGGVVKREVEGMDHGDQDVLAAEAPRKGGLRQTAGAPKFTAPGGPRASVLGLDRLAAEKRAQAAGIKTEAPPMKRIKIEVEEDENGASTSGGVFKVPALPIKREAARVKPEDTPSHGGGISESARSKLEAYRRERNKPKTAVSAAAEKRDDHRGLGDFQQRLNRGSWEDRRRDRNGSYGGDGEDRRGGKSWGDAPTPRSTRIDRETDGSVRVPNRGWDETPSRGGRGPQDRSRARGWDETPRRSRPGSPGEFEVDAKEWEEEQMRLDRDWYSTDDEGAVVSMGARR